MGTFKFDFMLSQLINIGLFSGLALLTLDVMGLLLYRLFFYKIQSVRNIIRFSFIASLVFFVLELLYYLSIKEIQIDFVLFRKSYPIIMILFILLISKVTVIIAFVISTVIRFFSIFKGKEKYFKTSRKKYKGLLWFVYSVFFIVSAMVFYAHLFGAYNYQIVDINLKHKELPKEFDGFHIVQISDTHLGSFSDTSKLTAAIELINSLNADLILFTGDLVNISPDEAKDFVPLFARLDANYGKFAILGNHDIGDYRRYGVPNVKESDIKKLKAIYNKMNFRLLIDEHQWIKRNGDSLLIVGVNNWGEPPFKKYGNLKKAMDGVNDKVSFSVLLSHDPTHWKAEVAEETNIQLTLSGHTHAMQFGINTKWLKWSPIQYKYEHWSGLYQQGQQYLYVNKGLGFIGFPGRLGMNPEITSIKLYCD